MAQADLQTTVPQQQRWGAVGEWAPARQAGVLGVMFVVSYLLVFFLLPGVPPDMDAAAADMRAYLADSRTQVLAHIVLAGLVFGVLLPAFAVGLHRATATHDQSVWRPLALVGAILIMAVTVAGGGVFMLAGAYLVPGGLSDQAARMLLSADLLAFSVLAPWGFALFAVANAMALRAAGLVPGWMSGAGIAVSVLLAVGSTWVFGEATGPMALVNFASILLWAVWVLVVSLFMTRVRAMREHGSS